MSLEVLQAALESYFLANNPELPEGVYLSSWSIVANFGNVKSPHMVANEYVVEAYPPAQSPHSIKGLLYEGVDFIQDLQRGYYDDDEEDD